MTKARFLWSKLQINKFKSHLIATAALLGLALIGSLMNSRESTVKGAGGPTVTIDPAQLPLAVKITSSVSGAVSATQSGAWNVGITGNTATNPLFVRNVDEPARNPFQATVPIFPGQNGCSTTGCNITVVSSVSAGKRLVITNVTGEVQVASGNVVRVHISNNSSAKVADLPFSIVPTSAGITTAMLSVPTQVFFETGEPLALFIASSPGGTLPALTMNVLISGYYIDL